MTVKLGFGRLAKGPLDAQRITPRRTVRPPYSRRKMFMEPLEPRLLLSADPAVLLAPPPVTDSPPPSAIVFVDPSVRGYATLVDAASLDAEVIVLDRSADGVTQIAGVLADRAGVSAVHIVSHGVAGRVTIGAAELDQASLEVHAEALRTWGEALSAGGDILFYGCGVGEGDTGAAFVQRLASLTGADIAASTDPTGSAALGGDWDLEARCGTIDAGALAPAEYGFLLAPALDAIVAVADSGSPREELLASANVRQAIVLSGSGFSLSSQVVFPTITNQGTVGTQTVKAFRVAADGSSITVVVPDTATTGNLTVVGGSGAAFLQVVPTIADIDLNANGFAAGSNFLVYGSGFVEGGMTIRFGATPVVDSSTSAGPDVFVMGFALAGGFDRADNEAVSLQVPTGAASGPITVETLGGTSAALPVSLSQVQSAALSGTPANPAQASANPGQTIRILGHTLDYSTEVIFPVIDINGVFSNRAVLADYVKSDGTLLEVRVPLDAVTGNLQVIGAAGTFSLQVVPVVSLAQASGGTQLRLLGAGFTEGSALSVNVNGTVVADTGANIDVQNWFTSSGDRLVVNTASSAGQVVSVSTAGGTSAPVTVARDDPATVNGMVDLAIFPPGAGADAGRLLVADGTNLLKVLDPSTLATLRTIAMPGTVGGHAGLAFIGAALTVNGIAVPAGSLAVINGGDTPDRLYYVNPASGAQITSVTLGGPGLSDEAGGFALAYHAGRGTLLTMRHGTDLVTEVNAQSGAALRSFHIGFSGSESSGALTVHPSSGTLLVASGGRLVEVDVASGKVLGRYDPLNNAQFGTVDLRHQGAGFDESGRQITGLAFDASGRLWASTEGQGRIQTLTLPGDPTSIQAVALDGTPADALLASANAGQRILITGSGYTRSTEVEFERVTDAGARGFIRVAADAVRADGSALEVVVPREAVTGQVRISGTSGPGLRLQITPTLRPVLASDPNVTYDLPLDGERLSLIGSGLVEGDTRISLGGVLIDDNSASSLVDVLDASGNGFALSNGRLDLNVPDRALAGPVTVSTDGGSFTVSGLPVREQAGVALTGLTGAAAQGTPANALAASANTGQTITLQGFGLTTNSLVSFRGVAEDGTRGVIVVRPSAAASDGTSASVLVPALAVSGQVTVAGAAGGFMLQVVPTLTGVSASSLTPGSPLWLLGSGIPEGGGAGGEQVTYTIGGVPVTDDSGVLGPDVMSALGRVLAIALNTPSGASGTTISVSTAGGSASVTLGTSSLLSIDAEADWVCRLKRS